MGWLVVNKVTILNNGCKYKGPKEGKSVIRNKFLAAELDYNLPAASTIKSMK